MTNRNGLRLGVEKRVTEDAVEVLFRMEGAVRGRLHWGTANREGAAWTAPAPAVWPAGTMAHGAAAVQTPFLEDDDGGRLQIRFPLDQVPPFLVFDLFLPDRERWENNGGRDFWIRLAEPGPAPEAVLDAVAASGPGAEEVARTRFALDGGGELATAIQRASDELRVTLVTDSEGPLLLHWGMQDRARARWRPPDPDQCPPGTVRFDAVAVRTPFEDREGLRRLTLTFPTDPPPRGLGFVLFQPEAGRWIKYRARDLFLKLSAAEAGAVPLTELTERIVEGEMGDHGWTLMHRFNLCHELIDEAGEDRSAWATLFVWLRYSAIRQLDWQRNYNTKPRELAHAQDRLTAKLAESFVRHPGQRDLIRLMLGSVGRGGEGQRIRDEILHIMHRHHIKEVGGTWMEQWHQKLHNNTTPDDVVICEAYLAFLRADGTRDAYDARLLEGGVTRERLAGFERPITQDPEWHPQLKDGLIHDFENYLQLLRSVHSGTDLQTAAASGERLLTGSARDALAAVRSQFQDPDIEAVELAGRITEIRQHLNTVLDGEQDAQRVKDGLYLDLALEEALRTVIERQLQARFGNDQLVALISLVLDNLLLTDAEEELRQCRVEWQALPARDRFSEDGCLRAKAVTDRMRRAAESMTDTAYQLLQPVAETLGRAFQAAEWTVTLFSEEIVRGRPLFVLSMLLQQLDRMLRKAARLGAWQVISPNRAVGEVRWVKELRSVQGQTFGKPTVILADEVRGDEEPPPGVRGVITRRSVDLVSHVAVRARNASLLFATCFEPEPFQRLKELVGTPVELTVTSSGDIRFERAEAATPTPGPRRPASRHAFRKPVPTVTVLRRDGFDPARVGGKSWRIRTMAERMPGEFVVPRSVALPFGVFDAVLEADGNDAVRRRFDALSAGVAADPPAKLAALRQCILELEVPDRLMAALEAGLAAEGITMPGDAARVADRVKQVWASLWNDRAYFSREANGMPHEAASMAVLIQEVVPAEYAFVLHTVNPATTDQETLYGEVVCGLGETLVGNYPGRALGFVARKQDPRPTIVSYPSKSVALRGEGLIFRSDSNAEDLEGYAGAGLYDSVLLDPPREERVDYTREALVRDEPFRHDLLRDLTGLGVRIEAAFEGPQDIEGAWANGRFHVVQTRPQVGLAHGNPVEP